MIQRLNTMIDHSKIKMRIHAFGICAKKVLGRLPSPIELAVAGSYIWVSLKSSRVML